MQNTSKPLNGKRKALWLLRSARAQRGVTMLFALIALLILMVGAMAVMRSFNASLFGAGNIAFRRDMVNQGERAVAAVIGQLDAGGFGTDNNDPSHNYSAVQLPTDAHGVPLALLTDSAFAAVASGGDIAGDEGAQIRYVVDRLCASEGAAGSAGACVYAPQTGAGKGGSSVLASRALASSSGPMYRISVRVSGPRGTQVFVQSSFSKAG